MVCSCPLITDILAHFFDKDSSGKSDQVSKRLSIFSVHVHPDGSRIATGGLDAKIRIWSTKPILNSASEQSNRPPKSLCTLTMHTGPVLCVRWANSGRWLASGSDDEIVMIWDLDPFVLSFSSLWHVPQEISPLQHGEGQGVGLR